MPEKLESETTPLVEASRTEALCTTCLCAVLLCLALHSMLGHVS